MAEIATKRPTRQDYEKVTFSTGSQRPSRREYEEGPFPGAQRAHMPQQVQPITDLSAHISRLAGIKPKTDSSIYGAFDVWAAPPDSEIWRSPGAEFTKEFGAGWVEQTRAPALTGKKIEPAKTKAGKIGRTAGQLFEAITELITTAGILQGVGLLPKAAQKGAPVIEKALQTGLLFGSHQTIDEIRKGVAEAIYDEDFGYRGKSAVEESFAFGMVLSLAGSGIGKVWSKLKPTEQSKALKILGLNKGASLKEINQAARNQARKYHPDKVKGMRDSFEKVIKARDLLRKMHAKETIRESAKQNFVNNIQRKMGVSRDVAQKALERIEAGESITKVDQMISQAKFGIKPLAAEIPKIIPEHIVGEERAGKIGARLREEQLAAARKKPTRLDYETKAPKPPAKPAEAKQPWEMTSKDILEEGLKGISKDEILSVQHWKGADAKGRVFRSVKEILSESEKVSGSVDESDMGGKRYFDRWEHRKDIQKALSEGHPIPREVLEEYASEPWAKEALEERPAVEGKMKYYKKADRPIIEKFAKRLQHPDLKPLAEEIGRIKKHNINYDTLIPFESKVSELALKYRDIYGELPSKTGGLDNFGSATLFLEEFKKAKPEAKVKKKISAKEEFKVGDVINTKGNSNMADPITIREIKGNTLKFTDAKGVEYSGMARATVRRLIEGGNWERTKPTPEKTLREPSVREEKAEEIVLNRANLPDKAAYKALNEKIAIAKYAEKRAKYKPEADFEKEFRSMSKAEQKRQIKDYRPGKALDAETFLKRLARLEPEFAENPVFVFKDGMLVFKDGFRYRIEPRWLGLDKSKLKEGQKVRIDLVDLSKKKPKGRPGFVDVSGLASAHKTFMGIVEPSKAVEIHVGKEAYATVIKGIHQKDVGRIEFNEQQIEGQDKTLNKLSQWFNKFSDKDLRNFMAARGSPRTPKAQRIQQQAIKDLPDELRKGNLFQTVQRIADNNYKYLQSVAGDDINMVEDYFYGIYKNPQKVERFLDYWKTTKRFIKEKKLPTVADALNYGLELRNYNPIENLKSEYMAISHLEGMNWMRDELLRTGKGKFIDEADEAPLEWDKVHDPIFKGLRMQPDLAKMINNLISTNKISQMPLANTLREINNVARTIKFIGSAFHLLSVTKQSVADSGYLGFLYKPTALRGFTGGFRQNDPVFKTTAYKDYVRHGGGHRYSVESEARRAFTRQVDKLNRNMGIAVKAGALPLKIPTGFVNWMFQSYIPKVKYAKYLDVMAEKEKKLGRKLTSPEKIDIIKEQQNFYGMMNERLFGRSGTVTSLLRFYFISPGYAEGNYRTMLKAATQWGGKTGFKANRSRSNIINSWLITGIAATAGTLAFTSRPPKKPETLDDARDLFKIDTGKKDEKGRQIMIDLMTYDKDYWNVAFNTLRLRPDIAIGKSWKRIGGMKAPTADMLSDLALMSMGKAIYDWKGDRVMEITDPFLQKVMKLTTHEVKKLSPISVSVFQQSRKRDIDTTVAAVETLLGLRPTKTEKDIREQKLISKIWSLVGQKEELSYVIGQSTEPKKTVEKYNNTVRRILDSPYIPKSMKAEWEPKLLVEYDKVVTWKRFPAGKMTDVEIQRAYDAHTLSVPYKHKGEPFRPIGAPKKGSEKRVQELEAEAKKRGIILKRGPRKKPKI